MDVDAAMSVTPRAVEPHKDSEKRQRRHRSLGRSDAYRAALEELTRDRVPLDWARTQGNLGNVLVTLGFRESGTARLEEAVAAYRAALEELTRDRVPLDWARTVGNQGVAMMVVAERTNDAALVEVAAGQIEAAYETTRSGGQEQGSTYYQEQLAKAQAIRDRLKGQDHALGALFEPPDREGQGLWPDYRQGAGGAQGAFVDLPQRQVRALLPVL
jgi:hypothetical protein